MKLIAAVDKNWAIGFKGQLLVSIRADQMNFKRETTGKVIVLGRKTVETFPGGLPLKQRRNIILSSKTDLKLPGGEIVHSIDELMELIKDVPTDDVYVVGGASVYKELLDYCNTAIITKIDYSYQADAYFPNLDKLDGWKLTAESEEQTCYDLVYTYRTYEKKLAK